MFALSSYKKFAIIVFCTAALVVTASALAQDDDPPARSRPNFLYLRQCLSAGSHLR